MFSDFDAFSEPKGPRGVEDVELQFAHRVADRASRSRRRRDTSAQEDAPQAGHAGIVVARREGRSLQERFSPQPIKPALPTLRCGGQNVRMGIAAAVILVLLVLVPAVVVVGLFVWAARKDGQEDRAVQARLGIRRRTRLGR